MTNYRKIHKFHPNHSENSRPFRPDKPRRDDCKASRIYRHFHAAALAVVVFAALADLAGFAQKQFFAVCERGIAWNAEILGDSFRAKCCGVELCGVCEQFLLVLMGVVKREKVLCAYFAGFEPENHATIGANYVLDEPRTAADSLQAAAAAHRLHRGKKQQHHFRANALSIGVCGAAVGAFVAVADFLAVATQPLRALSAQKAHDFDFKLEFLAEPFFHFCPFSWIFEILREIVA